MYEIHRHIILYRIISPLPHRNLGTVNERIFVQKALPKELNMCCAKPTPGPSTNAKNYVHGPYCSVSAALEIELTGCIGRGPHLESLGS